MLNISYPVFAFKIKQINGVDCIYDNIRKSWMVLTPEEWVRQNFIQYLIQTMQYPTTLIAVEKEIKVGELKKRFDILIYKNNLPWMIIECKKSDIKINGTVLQQILSYNTAIQAKYIVVTNGNNSFCWQIENNKITICSVLPSW